MPNIKSAEKRTRVIATKTLINQKTKSALKTALKKFDIATDKASASAAYKDAVKKIDKAVCKGIIHKNNAARKKSQLTKKFNAIEG